MKHRQTQVHVHATVYAFTGMIIPSLRLYFDVFAYEVEAGLLGQFDIIQERLVRRSGKNAVRPVSLVQQPCLENKLPVQQYAFHAVNLSEGNGTHPEVRVHFVRHHPSRAYELQFQVVQERIVGRPQAGVSKWKIKCPVRCSFRLRCRRMSVLRHCPYLIARILCMGDYFQTPVLHIGTYLDPGDVLLSDRLQPNGLPDTGNRRIIPARGVLPASRFPVVRIVCSYDKRVFSRL